MPILLISSHLAALLITLFKLVSDAGGKIATKFVLALLKLASETHVDPHSRPCCPRRS